MRTKHKTALITVTIFCVLTAVGAWALFHGQELRYRTAPVQHGDVNVAVSATGNPNAVVTVQVGSQVSGSVVALYADFNSKVTKGQLIARIDPAPFQAKVDQARANLEAAQANVTNAQANTQKALAAVQAANASLANVKAAAIKAQVSAQDAKTK